jgi:hypothetical protein
VARGGESGFYDLSLDRDILYTVNAAFLTYELKTAIGPITDTALFDNPGFSFPTLGGDLILNSSAAVSTFTAVTPT